MLVNAYREVMVAGLNGGRTSGRMAHGAEDVGLAGSQAGGVGGFAGLILVGLLRVWRVAEPLELQLGLWTVGESVVW